MQTSSPEIHSRRYLSYVLFLLTGVYAFNFIDRQILVILQESVKSDLGLSDTQLGLLTGPAFAFFYVLLGLPIARFADRSNRKNIISICLAVWSGFTALAGLATNYLHLVLARIGVGIGEAGCSPPAHALISDYFPPQRRATALAIYSSGIYIGVLLGFSLGGWLNDLYGWRFAFLALGLPGVLFALIIYASLKEPTRGTFEKDRSLGSKESTTAEILRKLWRKKSFVWMSLGCGFTVFVLYGVGSWFPSFFIRTQGLSSTSVGIYGALIAGVGGATGSYLGGFITDRIRKYDVRWYFWLPCLTLVISWPCYALFTFHSEIGMSILGLSITYILMTGYLAPSISMAHSMVGPHERAFTSSVLFLVLNLIGLGFGPPFVGWMSDVLSDKLGLDALRWGLFACSCAILPAVLCFLLAAKYLRDDISI